MLPRAKIRPSIQRKILKCFCADLTALKTAEFLGLNRKTIDLYFGIFRERITRYSIEEARFSGEVEIDESYFGARRVKGKRGRGAAGKTPVFGIRSM